MNFQIRETLFAGKAVEVGLLDNGVALLRIDLPGNKINKLSSFVMKELDAVFDVLQKESSERGSITGLVIYSEKPGCFVAGADIDEISALQTKPESFAFEGTQFGNAIFSKLAGLPFRTVAAVNGVSLGGGTELALACRYRLAADNAETRFGFPEVGLGFIPGWTGTVELPLSIGVESALGLILEPLKTWNARKAWKMGLVSELVPWQMLLARAVEVSLGAEPKSCRPGPLAIARRAFLERTSIGRYLLARLAKATIMKQTKGLYPAPLAALKVAMASLTCSRKQALELESRSFAALCIGEKSQNLVRLFNLMQMGKTLSLPLPAKIGVLGCGTMGAGIVQAAAYAGFEVVVVDPFPQAIERGRSIIAVLFASLVEKEQLSKEDAERLFGNISFVAADDFTSFASCDLVIEAIKEDYAVKQEAYLKLEKVLSPRAIIATNTSSLSVTKLASCLSYPRRFGALHFFNPVHSRKFVEVIMGAKTDLHTAELMQAFAGKLGKSTRIFKDRVGFGVNRILAPYIFEANKLFEEGVEAEEIDRAMVQFGMPMGPLALMDEVGLDICADVVKVMNAELGARFHSSKLLSFAAEKKFSGKKGGKGIYVYDKKGRKQGLNPEIQPILPASLLKKSAAEIQDRLVLAMVNEALRAMEENVAFHADDLDFAMMIATGWAPFRGGPLQYGKSLGARALLQRLQSLYAASGDENYKPSALLEEMAGSGWNL